MKLIKTDIPGYSYVENKNGITYYYTYRNIETRKPTRKKIFKCKEHNNYNLKHTVSITENVLKEETIKSIVNENDKSLDNEIIINHYTLSEVVDIWFEKNYNRKVRELKELFNGMKEEEFNNNSVVKKKLYSVEKRILTYNKNVRYKNIGQMKIEDIKRRHLNYWLEKELNLNLSLKSKYNIVVFLRGVVNSMIRNENLTIENVFNKLDIKNDRRQRTRVLNNLEIEKLLKECKKWNKPQEKTIFSKDNRKVYKRIIKPNYNIYTSVYLGVITAARSSTILTIKKEDIDLEGENITLINHKSKNSKYKIPLNEESIKWFKKKLKYYENDEYLIRPMRNYTKSKIGENNPLRFIPREVFNIMNELFNKEITDRKKNLERDKMVNFHTIRRSIATNLVKKGASIYQVKKFLDHRTIDITEHYLNLNYEDYKDNLSIFHNELFKGFNLKENEIVKEKNEDNDIKEKLVKSILVMSDNEENEMLKLSLETLSIEELKYKLTKYV